MPLILFLLSVIVLTLEVLETKIFAYTLENNLIFVVVGLVLLGFGAGGTVLALRKGLGEPREIVRRSLLACAVLVLLAHAYYAHVSDQIRFMADWITVSALLALAAPYVFAGMAISAILADPTQNVRRLYGVNLIGSAIGCTTTFFLLGPLTAPQMLVLCAGVLGCLAASLSVKPVRDFGLTILLTVLLLPFADSVLFPYQKEPEGQLALIEQNLATLKTDPEQQLKKAEMVLEYDRWDPTARVQVHSLKIESDNEYFMEHYQSVPNRWFTQDSSYGSPLIGAPLDPKGAIEFYERTCYGLGYFRKLPDQDVLIIGLGGAPDVQTALHHGAKAVTGVDINASTVHMVRGAMKDFLGDPYGDPRVRIVIQDGRSHVRATRQTFDLIQLSGVDTKSVLASGTLAVNESYLYTKRAFAEYLEKLTPEGVLCVHYAGDDFMHRMAITVLEVLKEQGVAAPQDHLVLCKQSAIRSMMVKRTPFTAEELLQLEAWIAASKQANGTTGVVLTMFELLAPGGALSLHTPVEPIFIPGRPTEDRVMQAVLAGTLPALLEADVHDLSPVPDSRPFFFHLLRREAVFERPPEYMTRLFTLAKIMGAAALVLILLPLVVFRVRGLNIVKNLPFTLYFACLGFGFVLAMIGLIQRYVLFLGHQSYAFSVVIGGLLVAAGIGSMWSNRFRERPMAMIIGAVCAIGLMLAAQVYMLDWIFTQTVQLSQLGRILVGVLVLLPLGVPLGMLFPTGLSIVQKTSPLFVPWAFGINGVFSVLGTTLVLPGAILYGFPTMTAAAAAVYGLAALAVVPVLARRGRDASAVEDGGSLAGEKVTSM